LAGALSIQVFRTKDDKLARTIPITAVLDDDVASAVKLYAIAAAHGRLFVAAASSVSTQPVERNAMGGITMIAAQESSESREFLLVLTKTGVQGSQHALPSTAQSLCCARLDWTPPPDGV
jgi:hypothetical protein